MNQCWILNKHGLSDICFTLGTVKTDNHLIFKSNEGSILVSTTIADVRRQWSALSYKIRSIRENWRAPRKNMKRDIA